jgi:hypothetical protein
VSLDEQLDLVMSAPSLWPEYNRLVEKFNFYCLNFVSDQDHSIAYRLTLRHKIGTTKFVVYNLTGNPNYEFDPSHIL